jgi:hypothetical protein
MRLDGEPKLLKQRLGAHRMSGTIAGRVVARDFYQLRQECGLAHEIAVDKRADLVGHRHAAHSSFITASDKIQVRLGNRFQRRAADADVAFVHECVDP